MSAQYKKLMEEKGLSPYDLPSSIQEMIRQYEGLQRDDKPILDWSTLTVRQKNIAEKELRVRIRSKTAVVPFMELVKNGSIIHKTRTHYSGKKNKYFIGFSDDTILHISKALWKAFNLPLEEDYKSKDAQLQEMDQKIIDAITNLVQGKNTTTMSEGILHQKLIDTYGIRVHKLPSRLADSIVTYQKLHEAYKAQWKKQHDFIDYKNLTNEEVEKVRLFLDKKRQFKGGKKSFNQMLSSTQFVGKGREGNQFILYMDDQRGYPVPEYIYHAILSFRPSSNKDGTDYGAMLHRADGHITQELIRFLKNRKKGLEYYLSDTGNPPADPQGASSKLKATLYDLLAKLVPDLIQLPICSKYQTAFQEGKSHQLSCVSKSGDASYFDLVEVRLNSRHSMTYKASSYTFYVQGNIAQPILAMQYNEEGEATKDLEVIQLMGGRPKDEQVEFELLKLLGGLLTYLVKQSVPFTPAPKAMELLFAQLKILQKNS